MDEEVHETRTYKYKETGKGTCIKFDSLHAEKKGVEEDTKEGIERGERGRRKEIDEKVNEERGYKRKEKQERRDA